MGYEHKIVSHFQRFEVEKRHSDGKMYRFEGEGLGNVENIADLFRNDEIRMLYDKKLLGNSKSAVISLNVS